MKLKSQGLTLIELLAVIVILSIILTITFPIVGNVIKNSKMNIYIKNEQIVKKAAKLYMNEHPYDLPDYIGDIKEVSIMELKNKHFLKKLQDPNNRNSECNGYVLVTKLSEDDYDYNPHIKCGDSNNINSATEDGLILHYKFDDFQEPTNNIAKDKFDYYAPYHEVIQDNTTLTFTMLGAGRYLVLKNNSLGSLSGRTFTYSGYMELNGEPYVPADKRFSSYNKAGDVTNFKSDTDTGYFEGTMHFSHASTTWILHWPVANQIGDVIVLKDFQIEEKPYRTPFVEGEREGVVFDHSGNQNHASLELNTTPQWVNEGIVGEGAYKFLGENNYIDAGNKEMFNLQDTFSLSLWVKYKNQFKGGIITKGQQRGWINNSYVLRDSGGEIRLYLSDGTNANYLKFPPLGDDKWYHLVAVLSSDKLILYLNGKKIDETARTIGALQTVNEPLRFGQGYTNSFYQGYLDDIRIYSRVLSSTEIKTIYEVSKRISK